MLSSPRASEHGVAGADTGAAARAPYLVPGRRAHPQQRAGLRALVPPGAAGPREAERVRGGDGVGPGRAHWKWRDLGEGRGGPVGRGGVVGKGGDGIGRMGGAL